MTDKIRRRLIVFLVLVFCIAAVVFGKSLWEYHEGEEIYESALEFVVETEPATETETEAENEEEEVKEEKKVSDAPVSTVKRTHSNIDFASLQAVNEDVFGWIQIFGTQVDYPLLDADDTQYYLKRTYDHRRSAYGSIFLEPRNSALMNEKHIVIYGHNMVNRAMFGSLVSYKNQGYANEHNTITICMPGRDLTYRVFSAYTASVDSPTYRLKFGNDGSFEEMIAHMKENSMIQSDITPKAGDQILTLSTCTPAGHKNYRFVVNAVLVNGAPIRATDKKEEHVTEPVVEEVPVEISEIAEEMIVPEVLPEETISQPEGEQTEVENTDSEHLSESAIE